MNKYLNRLEHNEKFLRLQQEIETEIHWDFKKMLKQNHRALSYEDFKLAQRANQYIQRKDKISQRKLLRHFSAKRKIHLDRIHDVLKINYGISIHKEGKSIYYLPLMKTKGIFWKVGYRMLPPYQTKKKEKGANTI